ncbi:MAG TPA: sigma-54-dependent Fis family transcriptional regulator, partial [Firmicutes bacterium]|nr:sigma-54-dependent Fis family transcriptional regulator [Bacillota bacterium]
DLFYRLNVVEIRLPPLRERPGDIMILADHFRQRFCARDQKRITGFTDRARDALESYRWPGNVRELENAIERAVVLTTGDTIDGKHLPKEVLSDEESGSEIVIPIGTTLDDAKCRIIRATLHAADGDKKRAAEMLGIATRTVYRTLERFCAGGGNEE